MTTVSNKSIEVAGAGEVVNIYVTGDDTIASGSFLSDPINVIPVTNRFRAQVFFIVYLFIICFYFIVILLSLLFKISFFSDVYFRFLHLHLNILSRKGSNV